MSKKKIKILWPWWDYSKKFTQGLTKDFCRELKETEKEHLHQLQLELQVLHIQKNKDQIKINNIEAEIEEIEKHHQKGAMTRSRTKRRETYKILLHSRKAKSKQKKYNETGEQKRRIKNKRRRYT